MDDVLKDGYHQEINWGGDTLPLYIKMPDGTYRIVQRLEDGMEFLGIATERGIILNKAIYPSKFTTIKATVYDLNVRANVVHSYARPLDYCDVLDSKDCITTLLDSGSKLFRTCNLLREAGVELPDFSRDIAYVQTDAELTSVSVQLYSLGGVSDPVNIKDVQVMYLFLDEVYLPAELQAVFPSGAQTESSVRIGDEGPVKPAESKYQSPNNEAEAERFPLALLLSNEHGDRIRSYRLTEGYKVDGVIMLGELVVLQKTIKPEATGRNNLTFHDLKVMADSAYRMSRPLYDEYACCPVLLTLLLLERKKYQETAQMLAAHGIKMPNINGKVYYTRGIYDDTNSVGFIDTEIGTYGSSRISCVEEMILVARAAELLPLEYSEY